MAKTAKKALFLVGVVLAINWTVVAADNLPPAAQGTFVQRRMLADVGVTLTSRGVFRFERDRFFEWTVREPVASVFYASPTNYAITVGGRTSTYALNVDVTSIARLFEIKEMKEYVRSVKAEPDKGFPNRVRVAFRNGDVLEIELKTEP